MNTQRLITLSLIVLAAACSRLLPHPANVTPIAAIALFAGAHFERKWLAFAVPAAAMLLSDAVIGFHNTLWAVYAGFAIVVCLGFTLRANTRFLPVAVATLIGSTLFFIISNLGVWLAGELYPLTDQGLIACFTAAIPFFTNSLLGDLFYTALLFGGFRWAEKRYATLTLRTLSAA